MFLTNTSSSMCPAKALEVTQQTNCVRHFIPECEEQLQEIQGQKEKGLLYGIPVSIKDHIGHKVLPFAPLKHPIMSQAGWRCGGTQRVGRGPDPSFAYTAGPGAVAPHQLHPWQLGATDPLT